MKMNKMNSIYVIQFIHRCLSTQRMKKFLRRLELINTNVETDRNDLPIFPDTFRDSFLVSRCLPR